MRSQLTWNWHRFDARRPGEEVIAHLPENDLYFTAHSIPTWAPRANSSSTTTASCVVSFSSPGGTPLTHLDIGGGTPYLTDLAPLCELPPPYLSWPTTT